MTKTKVTCGRFGPKQRFSVVLGQKKLVLVDLGRKDWFWSFLAGSIDPGPFWLKILILVDFGWKILVWPTLTGKTGFGRFWPETLVLVDFDQKNWFWSI